MKALVWMVLVTGLFAAQANVSRQAQVQAARIMDPDHSLRSLQQLPGANQSQITAMGLVLELQANHAQAADLIDAVITAQTVSMRTVSATARILVHAPEGAEISDCGAARDIQNALLPGLNLTTDALSGSVMNSSSSLQIQVRCGPGPAAPQAGTERRSLLSKQGVGTAAGMAHGYQLLRRALLQSSTVVPCNQRPSVVNITVDLWVPRGTDAAALRDAAVKVLYDLYRESALGGRCPVAILPDPSNYVNLQLDVWAPVAAENISLYQTAAATLEPQLLAIAGGAALPQAPSATTDSPVLCPPQEECACSKERSLWALVFLGLGVGVLAGAAGGMWWERRQQQALAMSRRADSLSDDDSLTTPHHADGAASGDGSGGGGHGEAEGVPQGRSSKPRASPTRDSVPNKKERDSGGKRDRDSAKKPKKPAGMMFQSTASMKLSTVAHAASAVQYMQQLAVDKAAVAAHDAAAGAGAGTSVATAAVHASAVVAQPRPPELLPVEEPLLADRGHAGDPTNLQIRTHIPAGVAALAAPSSSPGAAGSSPEGARSKRSLRAAVGSVMSGTSPNSARATCGSSPGGVQLSGSQVGSSHATVPSQVQHSMDKELQSGGSLSSFVPQAPADALPHSTHSTASQGSTSPSRIPSVQATTGSQPLSGGAAPSGRPTGMSRLGAAATVAATAVVGAEAVGGRSPSPSAAARLPVTSAGKPPVPPAPSGAVGLRYSSFRKSEELEVTPDARSARGGERSSEGGGRGSEGGVTGPFIHSQKTDVSDTSVNLPWPPDVKLKK